LLFSFPLLMRFFCTYCLPFTVIRGRSLTKREVLRYAKLLICFVIVGRRSLIRENGVGVEGEELELEAVSKRFIRTVNVMQLKK